MDAQERIDQLVRAHEVVLFMKGSRSAPQCGFSATVVDILDGFLRDYQTFDVLSDPSVREGVKQYSNWPTIPQLYVGGKLIGGCDIVKEMHASGELGSALGAEALPLVTPEVTVTEPARAALSDHFDGEGEPCVRLEIDRQFKSTLFFDAPKEDDVVIELDGMALVLDQSTARRSDGLTIDFVKGEQQAGFKLDNPNEPPRVKQLPVDQLQQWRTGNKPFHLFDVRTPEERATADIEGSIMLDERGQALLDRLDRAEPVVLFCHHGIRSQAAAEHVLRMGFQSVYNLAGGIDAWSREVDPSVPKY